MAQNLIGKVIQKRYLVEAFIDSGAMKTVYKVKDLERGVPLALKMLHSGMEEDPVLLRSFKRDAKAIKDLGHPNIVRFYGLEQSGKLIFMLEEYIDGPSLKDVLKEQGKLSVEESLIYFKALCAALGYAHNNNTIHCDVKPGNVMIDRGGNILLTDFGIARHAGSDITSTLAGAGTSPYMAPEQILERAVTAETDIYALGIMLYEMLTGQRPFKGTENGSEQGGSTQNERIRYAHLKLQPPDPRLFNKKLTGGLADAVLKALEKEPKDRYHSTQEFFEAVCLAAEIVPADIPNRATTIKIYADPNPAPAPVPTPAPYLDGGQQTGRKTWLRYAPFMAMGLVVVAIAIIFSSMNGSPTSFKSTGPSARQMEILITDSVEPTLAPTLVTTNLLPTPTQTPTQTIDEVEPTEETMMSQNTSIFSFALGAVGNSDIYIGNIDTGQISKVSNQNCDETEPSLSTDGEWIVYQENCQQNYNLMAINFQTGLSFQLTQSSEIDEREPDWSPDGTRIVYRSNPSEDQAKNSVGMLHLIDFQTQQDQELPVYGKGPVWSPDGEKIAYMSDLNGTWQIFVYDLLSNNSYQVTSSDTSCRWPAWSPNSDFLVYNSASGSDFSPTGIWIVPIEGGKPKELIAGSYGRPSWSSSNWILYNANIGIQALRSDGTNVNTIIADPAAWAPDL